jgi:hypothetical protein
MIQLGEKYCIILSYSLEYAWNYPGWLYCKHLYDSQNYWVSGLCPSSGIRITRKHNVLETVSVSVLKWREGDTYLIESHNPIIPSITDSPYKSQNDLTTDGQLVCPGIRPPARIRDHFFFLTHGICLQMAAFFVSFIMGRPFWREVRSIDFSVRDYSC